MRGKSFITQENFERLENSRFVIYYEDRGLLFRGRLAFTHAITPASVRGNSTVKRVPRSLVSTTKPGGSGLGLAIAHRAIEAHKGVVLVDTNERGTRFTVLLPRTDAGVIA